MKTIPFPVLHRRHGFRGRRVGSTRKSEDGARPQKGRLDPVFRRALASAFCFFIALAGTAAEGATTETFPLENRHFSPYGGGPYLSLNPGHQLVLSGEDEEDGEVILTITVLNETKVISVPSRHGRRQILTRVVEERELQDGELADVSRFYYARCLETSDIYLFGESTRTFDEGIPTGYEEAWEAGVNGAVAGIVMPGTFMVGARYLQGAIADHAVHEAENVAMGLTVETPAGTYQNCIKIQEVDPIEPDDLTHDGPSIKLYAPAVGLVQDDGLQLAEVRLGALPIDLVDYHFLPFGDHPYLPVLPGLRWEFAGAGVDQRETQVHAVLEETKEIVVGKGRDARSITAAVVEKRAFREGSLRRLWRDYLAQCSQTGDVYLFGREVVYELGEGDRTRGWLAGVDGAEASLLMPASFVGGAVHVREQGSAQSIREGVHLDDCVTVKVPAGEFVDCVRIQEFGAMENEGGESAKIMVYAPSVGLVADGELELTRHSRPASSEAGRLHIEDAILLSWPLLENGAFLEGSSDLEQWRPVPQAAEFREGRYWLSLSRSDAARYYRLSEDVE